MRNVGRMSEGLGGHCPFGTAGDCWLRSSRRLQISGPGSGCRGRNIHTRFAAVQQGFGDVPTRLDDHDQYMHRLEEKVNEQTAPAQKFTSDAEVRSVVLNKKTSEQLQKLQEKIRALETRPLPAPTSASISGAFTLVIAGRHRKGDPKRKHRDVVQERHRY